MPFLIILSALLIGFMAGKILTIAVLGGITIISVVISIALSWGKQEMEMIPAMIFMLFALFGDLTMWITYYITSNQSWIGNFFNTYIFR